MNRVAVFVDAGYLFAQGSVALSGAKKNRGDLILDPVNAIDSLRNFARSRAPECSLLRVYWYDGAVAGNHLTAEQSLLAKLDDVKIRLGFVNTAGQQKGVDSLIVTDLIELARQKAICDAVLLSGDEDVRIGVQIAQNHGVRLHFLGIHPSRGSQSLHLMHEADTTSEWDAATVRKFLSLRQAKVTVPVDAGVEGGPDLLAAGARSCVDGLADAEIAAFLEYSRTERGVPSDLDRKLLSAGRALLGRNLDEAEKRAIRKSFRACVVGRVGNL